MSVILLTNDDGIDAPGLRALEEILAPFGDLWVAAPDTERSACGRSVTLDRPLRVRERGPRRFSVTGTPADCVLLAYRTLMPSPPEVVVSGVNQGLNVGEDVDYSGTVGAASEGALQGCRRSMAVSLDSKGYPAGLDVASQLVGAMVGSLVDRPLPASAYLNINLPARPNRRFRLTRQGNPLGTGDVLVDKDPRGKTYYWIAERPDEDSPPADTDRGAIRDGCISISLLTLDRNFHGGWASPLLDGSGFQEEPP